MHPPIERPISPTDSLFGPLPLDTDLFSYVHILIRHFPHGGSGVLIQLNIHIRYTIYTPGVHRKLGCYESAALGRGRSGDGVLVNHCAFSWFWPVLVQSVLMTAIAYVLQFSTVLSTTYFPLIPPFVSIVFAGPGMSSFCSAQMRKSRVFDLI